MYRGNATGFHCPEAAHLVFIKSTRMETDAAPVCWIRQLHQILEIVICSSQYQIVCWNTKSIAYKCLETIGILLSYINRLKGPILCFSLSYECFPLIFPPFSSLHSCLRGSLNARFDRYNLWQYHLNPPVYP